MPHQTVLGYCLNYKENEKHFRNYGLKFDEDQHHTAFRELTFSFDSEHSFYYIVFWEDYTEGEYGSYPIDFVKLAKFREKVEKLIEDGVIPKTAVFGVHTYY